MRREIILIFRILYNENSTGFRYLWHISSYASFFYNFIMKNNNSSLKGNQKDLLNLFSRTFYIINEISTSLFNGEKEVFSLINVSCPVISGKVVQVIKFSYDFNTSDVGKKEYLIQFSR